MWKGLNEGLKPIVGGIGKAIERIGANVTGAILIIVMTALAWTVYQLIFNTVAKWNFDRVVVERNEAQKGWQICDDKHEQYIQRRLDRLEGIENTQKATKETLDTLKQIIE